MNKKGFTLIELLVVISIIGILAGLTLSSFTAAQKQARDTTRKSDLNQYRIALENYASNNNQKYPGYTVANVGVNAFDYLFPKTLSNFMSSGLKDPKNTGSYIYWYRGDGVCLGTTGCGSGLPVSTQYVLYDGLETGGYWVICSNGKAGKASSAPTNSTCPL